VPEQDLLELIESARTGDQAAWDNLVDRFTGFLWAIAKSYGLDDANAADAVQTTWLRFVDNLDRISDMRATPAWLGTTMRRECILAKRRGRREEPASTMYWLDEAGSDEPPVDSALLSQERDAALWHAFGLLEQHCQQLLRVLTATPRPTYAAVAAALNMRIGSIGPTRQRCLRRLRELLAGTLLDDAHSAEL
jgi:RNA polymerase sigma factor (sigma-70 family)